jgi:hypothetical protein
VVYGTYQAYAVITDAIGEDATATQTVNVVVVGGTSETVSIAPATASLTPSGTQSFTASIDGTPSVLVTWSITSGGGTVNSSGTYTAPSAGSTTAIVRATSNASASYAEATVTVIDSAAPGTATVTTTWTNAGNPLASTALDYWVISSTDALITNGNATTSASGVLVITVPNSYTGQKVLVVMNNVGSDMLTAGKIRGQQVAVVV